MIPKNTVWPYYISNKNCCVVVAKNWLYDMLYYFQNCYVGHLNVWSRFLRVYITCYKPLVYFS